MVTKNDIQIISVIGNEDKNIVSVNYKIAEFEDTIDFVLKDGKLIICSGFILQTKLGNEINNDVLTAVIDKTIEYLSELN